MLKGIQQGLKLPADSMIPSFAALRDYGNTSCSTTWYVLAYTESCRDVRRGDVLLQVGGGWHLWAMCPCTASMLPCMSACGLPGAHLGSEHMPQRTVLANMLLLGMSS